MGRRTRKPLKAEVKQIFKRTKRKHGHNVGKLRKKEMVAILDRHYKGGAWKDLLNPITAIKRTVAAVKGERTNAPPDIRKWLEHDGNKVITSITVCREPIAKAVSAFLQIATQGGMAKAMQKYGYTDVFHLYVLLNVGGHSKRLEKNQTVTLSNNHSLGKDHVQIRMRGNITLNDFMQRGEQLQGSASFFVYDPRYSCCVVVVASV